MTSGEITPIVGIISVLVAVAGLLIAVRSTTRKDQVKAQEDSDKKFDDGVEEGKRRERAELQPKIDRLAAQLELRTSERDQARSDLGESRNQYRDRRGRD